MTLPDPENHSSTTAQRWRPFLVTFGILALVSFLVFANSLTNGFALDDESIIVQNRLIKSLTHLPALFISDYWASILGPGYGGNIYRSLVLVSFALNYAVGGLNPFGYHLVNLLLQLGVCLAMYALARQLDLSRAAALPASTVFAVHPLHTEAVFHRALTISERLGGPGHPAVADALSRLAALYASPVARVVLPGGLERAEPLFQRELAIREKALGPDNPAVAQSLEEYAGLFQETNRMMEASQVETRALAIRAKYGRMNAWR